MHSCLYVGHVCHRRYEPEHRFRYRLYMFYVDLAELPGLWHARILRSARFAPVAFRNEDHPLLPARVREQGHEVVATKGPLSGDHPDLFTVGSAVHCSRQPLAEAVCDLVDRRIGKRPVGPIRLLTGLRCLGYYFSPLNLYYCFDSRDQTIDTVVAEVSNTPWGETHYYVLSPANRSSTAGKLWFSHPKTFHVSPFMGMDMQYDWRLNQPGSRLSVQITNRGEYQTVFKAHLALVRRELNRASFIRVLCGYPWMSGRIMLGIYYQAFRLWRKKCPFHAHP